MENKKYGLVEEYYNRFGELAFGEIDKEHYYLLKGHEYNRNINEKLLDKLRSDFNSNLTSEEYPFEAPVVIFIEKEGNFKIIQGHHRAIVCKEQGRNIRFTVTKEDDPEKGQDYKDSIWDTDDKVDKRVKQENKYYIEAKEIVGKTNGKYSYQDINIMFTGKEKSIVSEEFEFTEEERKIALQVMEKYEQWDKIMDYTEHQNTKKANGKILKIFRLLLTNNRYKALFDWEEFMICSKLRKRDNFYITYGSKITRDTEVKFMIQDICSYSEKIAFRF